MFSVQRDKFQNEEFITLDKNLNCCSKEENIDKNIIDEVEGCLDTDSDAELKLYLSLQQARNCIDKLKYFFL